MSPPSVKLRRLHQSRSPKSVKLRHTNQSSLQPSPTLSKFDRMSRIHALEISRSVPTHPNHPPIVQRPEKPRAPIFLLHPELPSLSASLSIVSSASDHPSSEDTEPPRFSGQRTASNSPVQCDSLERNPLPALLLGGSVSLAVNLLASRVLWRGILRRFTGGSYDGDARVSGVVSHDDASRVSVVACESLNDSASRVSGGGGSMNPAALSELSFIQIIQIYNEPWKYRKKVIK